MNGPALFELAAGVEIFLKAVECNITRGYMVRQYLFIHYQLIYLCNSITMCLKSVSDLLYMLESKYQDHHIRRHEQAVAVMNEVTFICI